VTWRAGRFEAGPIRYGLDAAGNEASRKFETILAKVKADWRGMKNKYEKDSLTNEDYNAIAAPCSRTTASTRGSLLTSASTTWPKSVGLSVAREAAIAIANTPGINTVPKIDVGVGNTIANTIGFLIW
jgi:hypothetical protein